MLAGEGEEGAPGRRAGGGPPHQQDAAVKRRADEAELDQPGRGQIQLRALHHEPIVTLTRASKLRSTLETACHAAGFAPRIVAETSDLAVVAELAAEQVGVAVLPASGMDGVAGLVQLGLTHPRLDRRILLVWRPATSPPAGRAFLTLARQHLTPPPGST